MNIIYACIIGIVALILLLLLIAVIRTLFIRKPSFESESSVSFSEEEEKKYAKILSDMIKVPTISAKEGDSLEQFDKLHEVMKEHFPNVFSKMEVTDLSGNLLLKWRGKDSSKDGVLLMGHQDVVPAAETTWEHEPFSGDIVDGKVHGRGAMDCKNTVMAEFQAVEELISEGFEPERDIYLASSVNEEISGGGAVKTVEYLKDNGIRLAVVMDEGGAIADDVMPGMKTMCAAAGIVEKGHINIKFTAKSNGGHSSTPPRNNPFARLAKFINFVETKNLFDKSFTEPLRVMFKYVSPYLSFPFRLVLSNIWLFGPILKVILPKVSGQAAAFLGCTKIFTMAEGSKAPNVIPDEAYVIANLRPGVQQSAEECIAILTKIAAKYDIETEVLKCHNASSITNYKGEEFSYLEKCVRSVYPDVCFTPFYCTGGTDCRNYTAVSDNCIRFCPVKLNPKQLVSMHAANENIDTDALAQSVKFYKYFLKNHN